ncbi:uncharacterized protein [Euphorbia lathyris]|uniref:uncharacterized protein isoform X2 n=1 Tax=Euphorbia lathyris TaxID=212925 RepID=UPI0033143BB5
MEASDSSATESDVDITSQGETNLLDSQFINFLTGDRVTKSVDEVGDASRDSWESIGSMLECSWYGKKDCDEQGRRLSSDVKQKSPAINVSTSVEKDLGVGRLANGLFRSVESSMLPKSFELDRCTTLKGDDHGCANFSAGGADLLKACNCSFCIKAAYIWSDLHYQDIRGRLGAQWQSLFHHMEETFVHESNQLQPGFVALKDLREQCKTDLERTTGMPYNKEKKSKCKSKSK